MRDVFCGWCPSSGTCQPGVVDGPLDKPCLRGWLHTPLSRDTPGDQAAQEYMPSRNVSQSLHSMCLLNDQKVAAQVRQKVEKERAFNETQRESYMQCSPCTGTWPRCDCGGNDPLQAPEPLEPSQVRMEDGEAKSVAAEPQAEESEEEKGVTATVEAARRVAKKRAEYESARSLAESLQFGNATKWIQARREARQRDYGLRIARAKQDVVGRKVALEAAEAELRRSREAMATASEDKELYKERQQHVESAGVVRDKAEAEVQNATASVDKLRVRIAEEEEAALEEDMEALKKAHEMALMDEALRQQRAVQLGKKRALADEAVAMEKEAAAAAKVAQQNLKVAEDSYVDKAAGGGSDAHAAHDKVREAQRVYSKEVSRQRMAAAEAKVAGLEVAYDDAKLAAEEGTEAPQRKALRGNAPAREQAVKDEEADEEAFGAEAEAEAEKVMGVTKEGGDADEEGDEAPQGAAGGAADTKDQIREAPSAGDLGGDEEADGGEGEGGDSGSSLQAELAKLAKLSPAHRVAALRVQLEEAQLALEEAKKHYEEGGSCGRSADGKVACPELMEESARDVLWRREIADILQRVADTKAPGVSASLQADHYEREAREAQRAVQGNVSVLSGDGSGSGSGVDPSQMTLKALQEVLAKAHERVKSRKEAVRDAESKMATALEEGTKSTAEAARIRLRHKQRELKDAEAQVQKLEAQRATLEEAARGAMAAQKEEAARAELERARADNDTAAAAEAEEAVAEAERVSDAMRNASGDAMANMSVSEAREAQERLEKEVQSELSDTEVALGRGNESVEDMGRREQQLGSYAEQLSLHVNRTRQRGANATGLEQSMGQLLRQARAMQTQVSNAVTAVREARSRHTAAEEEEESSGGGEEEDEAERRGKEREAQAEVAGLTSKQQGVQKEVAELEARLEKDPQDADAEQQLRSKERELQDVAVSVAKKEEEAERAVADGAKKRREEEKETEASSRGNVATVTHDLPNGETVRDMVTVPVPQWSTVDGKARFAAQHAMLPNQ